MSADHNQPDAANLAGKLAEAERYADLVAHELNGPLVTLQGYLSGLENAAQAGDSSHLREDLGRMADLARDLRATVDALLTFARSGGQEIAREPVSLGQAAGQACDVLRAKLDRQRAVVNISPALPMTTGNPVLWRQVFQNLVENSLKACTGVASPCIDVGCELRGDKTICYVRDNGAGMPPELAAALSASPAQLLPGTGFGLAFVRKIIERHGETLGIDVAGPGTTIWWTILPHG